MHTVRIWDLPTRLFHWLLVVCVAGSIISAKIGGNAMVWHGRFGAALLALLAFRLLWGLLGGHWSRFASFVQGPGAVLAHLRGSAPPTPGHNPLGALSVLAMLLLLCLQIGSGLMSDDEIAYAGPLARLVPGATVELAGYWHKSIGQYLLFALLALHLLAIAWHAGVRRENLVGPMFSGDKTLAQPVAGSRDDAGSRALAALLFTACAALAAWVLQL